MSTYAVFGMTKPRAIRAARDAMNKKNPNKMFIPESQWEEMVSEKADEIMKSRRCVMLSEKFDAPQFAKEFNKLAKRIESRDLHIKAWCKAGYRNDKTGKEVMHWVSI